MDILNVNEGKKKIAKIGEDEIFFRVFELTQTKRW
jgi:hypothetical protein